jgi:hypothetical protein
MVARAAARADALSSRHFSFLFLLLSRYLHHFPPSVGFGRQNGAELPGIA